MSNKPLLNNNNDDEFATDVYVEMEEGNIDTGFTDEYDFISNLYKDLLLKQHRKEEDGLYRSDFEYDMIKIETLRDTYYWIASDHPIARTLSDNEFQPEHIFQGKTGQVAVYCKALMDSCIDQITEMCLKYNYKINLK